MRTSCPWILCASFFFAGCGAPDRDDYSRPIVNDWRGYTVTDRGDVTLCANTADANGTVHVSYQYLCLSSSCSRNRVGSCEASLDGVTISVTSQFSYEENVGENVPCTEDCANIQVDCGEVGPLPAGAYIVVHGGSSREVQLPNDGC